MIFKELKVLWAKGVLFDVRVYDGILRINYHKLSKLFISDSFFPLEFSIKKPSC